MSESCTLARKMGIGGGAWRGKGGLTSEEKQVQRRGRESKKNLRRRSRRKHEPVSGCKNTQSLTNIKLERRLGDEGPVRKMTERNTSE